MSERICHLRPINLTEGFLDGSVVNSAAMQDTQETGVQFVGQRFPGGENGQPLQCSRLENPMDRRACLFTSVSIHLKKGHNWNFGDL